MTYLHLLVSLIAAAPQAPFGSPQDDPTCCGAAPRHGAPRGAPASRTARFAKPAGNELTRTQAEARALCSEAHAAFKEGDFARASALAARSVALDPDYETSVRLVGRCAAATGDDREAQAAFTRALNMNPGDGELQFLLAGCFKRQRQWGAARDLLQQLLERDGPTLPVLLDLSECCLGGGDGAGALAAMERARALAPDDRPVAERVVDVLGSTSQWGKAASALQALAARSPRETALRYRLVQALLNAGKLAEAVAELESLAAALPDDPRPHELLAALYSGFLPDPARREIHRAWLKEREAPRR
jgi:predicted Zn-dependent protease